MRANFFGSTACYLKKDNKILFIKFNKKWGQVYAPIGGKIEAGETPTECLLREFKEETGLEITNYKLFDVDSVTVDWQDDDKLIRTHHIGVFYKVLDYNNEIKKEIKADEINDDSLGAEFFDINSLSILRFNSYFFFFSDSIEYCPNNFNF